jgi:hypothetical protein
LEGISTAMLDESLSPSVDRLVQVIFQDERDLFEEEILGGLARHSADYLVFYQTGEGTPML